MPELYWKPAHELAAMIRRREIKAAELMEQTIRRIEQTNPKLNAFCALRAEDAMKDARAIDEKIARRDEVGPLAGLPLGVKDLEDVAGLPTTFGSKPFKNNLPASDSVQVARLKAAGASLATPPSPRICCSASRAIPGTSSALRADRLAAARLQSPAA
jgi:Asp-tRNA(Asn)/Glu-tRNA(Gln) amidotransferase A subunit family amidase